MGAPRTTETPGGFGKKWVSDFGPFLTLGLQLAISVVAFFFLGQWLDGKFDTAPWLMITGLVIGVIGGFLKFFKTAMALGRKAEEEAREEKEHMHHES